MAVDTYKQFKRAYGFDEIALVPSEKTIDLDIVDLSINIAGIQMQVPIFASAMDSVVNPETASLLHEYGCAGVLNLEGIQTRYSNPDEILKKIASVSNTEYVHLMQSVYQEQQVQHELVTKRIKQIKSSGAKAIVSITPQRAKVLAKVAVDAGADVILIQSTVVSTHYKAKEESTVLDLFKFCRETSVPVMVGNTATYNVTLELMQTGVQAVFVGIGPGAACTTRGVLGIGVPMATSVSAGAAARETYLKQTGNYIPVIADGGIVNSGDICKALACGADAVMIGSPFARSKEAPGHGFHWGMATPNAVLPRGARIEVGTIASLKEIVHGPSNSDDGSQNLGGAIRTAMATLGAETVRDMHNVEVIVAPSLLTEGKIYQKAQKLGMYK